VPAYRLYRALFLGTFEVHLIKATSDERRATSGGGRVAA
jgi:hypothetical protein